MDNRLPVSSPNDPRNYKPQHAVEGAPAVAGGRPLTVKKKMGVETDFVLGDSSQASDVLASVNPAKEFNGVYAKGTDQISLSCLISVFADEESSPALWEEFTVVTGDDDGGAAVCSVPRRLRDHLKELEERVIPKIVEEWMQTDTFELTGWDSRIASDFLHDIKSLLNTEGADAKDLWMVVAT